MGHPVGATRELTRVLVHLGREVWMTGLLEPRGHDDHCTVWLLDDEDRGVRLTGVRLVDVPCSSVWLLYLP